MIQAAATSSSAGHTQAAGKAHGAAVNAAGSGSFSALLDLSGGLEAAPAEAEPATEADASTALAALLSPVAAGNTGKATGKTLPGANGDAAAGTDGEADADTDGETASLEATPDAAVMSLALAGVLPLADRPLPGAGATTARQSPAAGTSTQSAARLMTGTAAVTATSASTRQATALPTHAQAQGQAPASSNGTVNAPTIPDVALAPVTVVAEQPAAASTTASDAVPAIAAQLATRPQVGAAGSPTAQPSELQAQQSAQTVQPAQQAQAVQTLQPAQGNAASFNPRVARTGTDQPEAGSLKTSAKLEGSAQTEQASPLARMIEPAQAAAAAPATPDTIPAPVATSASAASGSVDGPQDFSTLVSRLAEAREAANPHVVKTAINHAEFGQISLQFRHEDKALSVTMVNADPGFTSAVHAAANASLAGGSNGNGSDSPQQQQQYTPASSQNQAAANGAGAGMGNGAGQNSQARADQAEQSMNRGQGTASLPHDQEASAPGQSRDGTRRAGGIYA
ncbi:hypothetical protein [Novosphingobium album (ex Hu et al. 2023)]|uniref:Flagellar hook-length control protein FliK n=1 Tax=Novosphingobium album (ex Hu et al. 2023) TaxID=2930093 RepID=A0ABT0B029_9SPHN|nr:hypothetical protein [Novosphingobium album (ex Hu et al. 2023)]MCJ2178260.1 hypothetical protein [Novosphingobium album (ex Hu et al. 2023)]